MDRFTLSNDDVMQLLECGTGDPTDVLKLDIALKNAEAELDMITRQMENLDINRRTIEKYTVYQKALAAPIRRLPKELLVEIFLSFGQEYDFISHISANPDREIRAMTLASVSRLWRTVAQGCRPLWASITVDFPFHRCHTPRGHDACESSARIRKLLELHLSCSGNSRLQVILNGVVDGNDRCCQIDRHSIEQVAQHCSRIESLIIGKEMLLEPVRNIFKERGLASLVSLTLEDITGDGDPLSPHPELNCFSEAPHLQEVHIQTIHTSFISLPWNQLQRFETESHYTEDILDVLRNNKWTSLSKLIVAHPWDSGVVPDEDSQIIINLSSFVIRISKQDVPDSLMELFDFLTFPNLSNLTIAAVLPICHHWDFPFAQMENMLARSSCSIRTFVLKRIPVIITELLELLELMPDLQVLELWESFYHPDESEVTMSSFIEALSVTPSSFTLTPRVPKLDSLILKSVTIIGAKWVGAMIHSRHEVSLNPGVDSVPLKSMEIHFRNSGYYGVDMKEPRVKALQDLATQMPYTFHQLKVVAHDFENEEDCIEGNGEDPSHTSCGDGYDSDEA